MELWVGSLLEWFALHQRTMPWRSAPSPYAIWVSEIMLQQTQVETVIPYFRRFMKAFPTVTALAQAPLQEVLKVWEGLGYYSRARNLHRAAQKVVTELGGIIPQTYETLQALPGLGPYTAAAVASIAFGERVPVVDGNVLRVFARVWGISRDIRLPNVRAEIFERLQPFIATADPSAFNQAIMEVGALVCKPKAPKCPVCPLNRACVAYQDNKTDLLPVKSKKAPVPHYEIAVGVVWKEDRVLIGRRKTDQMLGGLWEFPGGKRKGDERLEETAVREIEEETGLKVYLDRPYCRVKHAYTHFKITLTAFKCTYVAGTATPHSTDELRWIPLSEIDTYPFPKANKRVIEVIREEESTLMAPVK